MKMNTIEYYKQRMHKTFNQLIDEGTINPTVLDGCYCPSCHAAWLYAQQADLKVCVKAAGAALSLDAVVAMLGGWPFTDNCQLCQEAHKKLANKEAVMQAPEKLTFKLESLTDQVMTPAQLSNVSPSEEQVQEDPERPGVYIVRETRTYVTRIKAKSRRQAAEAVLNGYGTRLRKQTKRVLVQYRTNLGKAKVWAYQPPPAQQPQ